VELLVGRSPAGDIARLYRAGHPHGAGSKRPPTLPLGAGSRRAAAIQELDVGGVAVVGAEARNPVAQHAEVRLPGAALDGSAAAALHVNVVRPTVLHAEGGCPVGGAAVGGLLLAALRILAAAVDQVKLARQSMRGAETCPAIFRIAKYRLRPAAWALATAMDKVDIGGPLVAIAEQEDTCRWVAKCRAYAAASAECTYFAEEIHFRFLTMLLAMDGAPSART
jgi:hypothetical protein